MQTQTWNRENFAYNNNSNNVKKPKPKQSTRARSLPYLSLFTFGCSELHSSSAKVGLRQIKVSPAQLRLRLTCSAPASGAGSFPRGPRGSQPAAPPLRPCLPGAALGTLPPAGGGAPAPAPAPAPLGTGPARQLLPLARPAPGLLKTSRASGRTTRLIDTLRLLSVPTGLLSY